MGEICADTGLFYRERISPHRIGLPVGNDEIVIRRMEVGQNVKGEFINAFLPTKDFKNNPKEGDIQGISCIRISISPFGF